MPLVRVRIYPDRKSIPLTASGQVLTATYRIFDAKGSPLTKRGGFCPDCSGQKTGCVKRLTLPKRSQDTEGVPKEQLLTATESSLVYNRE